MNAPALATSMAPESQETTVAKLARSVMARCGNDVYRAARELEKIARTDPPTWQGITEPLLATACYAAVREVCHEQRRKGERSAIYLTSNYDKGGNGSRVIAHGESLMDWPLPGGMRLRDAKADDLTRAAAFYAAQASTMAHTGRWLCAIAEKIGKKSVGKALDAHAIAAIKESVK